MITVKNLTLRYKNLCAVDDVSFRVKENEIFGIIGLNGAGKTSTIECMEGLRKPTSGEIRICGFNPEKDRERLNELIGIQLQDTTYQSNAKVCELCELFASFYKDPVPYQELLKMMGIEDKKKTMMAKLSGGQKQKLSIVLALISRPKVLFLDELTTGLDPIARHDMWELILNMRKKGITIVLISHFMDEVEAICDRVAVMNQGKIIAMGTVREIVRELNLKEEVTFKTKEKVDEFLKALDQVDQVQYKGDQVIVYGEGDDFVSSVMVNLDKHHILYHDVNVKKPDLEEVFLHIAGRPYNDNEKEVHS